ncbi:dihydropyrimidinase [Clostridium sp. AM58-1XD]|uniref:dihydropyrimidinase n=1 Tax=Clostridium sp. AM58-1XD TaxID=2292307 RepID=UPI000E54EF12|nr:dihydropyrimidinase [Clostridium sp. AM58-1XD]RGY98575.1 dihydropyrimidinase [Clostridium sp. AM58-1XD]
MLDFIIKNGLVVNADKSEHVDVAVKDGTIAALGKAEQFAEAKEVIDADGMYVVPGMIDSHAHIASTGKEFNSLDNYYSGTIAAAYGGTTSVVDFSFLKEGETPAAAFERKLNEAKGNCVVDYSFHPCINKASSQFYGEVREIIQSGFPSVKMFTVYRDSLMLEKSGIYEMLKIAAEENAMALIHAESADMVERNIADAVSSGRTTPWDHAKSRPPITELEAMYGITAMVRETGTPVIFAHMTTGRAGKLLEKARRDLPVFAEVCPHYLTLTEEKYKGEDGCNYVCSPPLRSEEEREGLWKLVENGLVDIINSDHTDYSSKQKRVHAGYFPDIPNGLPTIENRGIVLFSEGVMKNRITVNRFVELTSANTARLMGLYPRKGIIAVGSDADLAVIDPKCRYTHTAANHHMVTDFSPFEGMEITGKVIHTIVRGNFVIFNGKYVDSGFRGELMKRFAPIIR